MILTKYSLAVSAVIMELISTLMANGQTPPSNELRDLLPNQTIEREMMGAQTHGYRFDLKANEFFQVRVEQKGVDVLLKLLDSRGHVLATMDSPNSKDGPETLSFVASTTGQCALEISGFDPKAEKGVYAIRREAPRAATSKDCRRVEVERLFVAGMTARDAGGQAETAISKLEQAQDGWREFGDEYLIQLTAGQIKQLRDTAKKPAEQITDPNRAQPITNLRLNDTLERELHNDETHQYILPLKSGEFAQIRVEQKGVDAILSIHLANGMSSVTMDSPSGRKGWETISCIAETEGDYRVEISRKPLYGFGHGPDTEYNITLITKRPVILGDRNRIEAERALFAAQQVKLENYEDILARSKNFEALLPAWRELKDDYVVGVIENEIARLREFRLRVEASDNLQTQKLASLARRRAADSVLQLIVETGHSQYVGAIAFSPDGKLLASTGSWGDGTVKLWDVRTGQELKTLTGHNDGVFSVAFSPDGKLLVSGGGGSEDNPINVIKIWDVATGQELRTLRGHEDWVTTVAFSPNGRTLASGSQFSELDNFGDPNIRLWDVMTGRELKILEGHDEGVEALVFSPDGKILASAGHEEGITLWEIASGYELRTLKGHKSAVGAIAFSADGQILFSGGNSQFDTSENTIKLWNVSTGQELRTLNGYIKGGVTGIAISSDGQTLISVGSNRIQLWNIRTGLQLKTLSLEAGGVVAFSPDRRLLASGPMADADASLQRGFKLWDVASGQEVITFSRSTSTIEKVEFSPDAQILAAWNQNRIVLWNTANGDFKTLTHTETVYLVAFSSDSKILVSTSGNVITLWDAINGLQLKTFTGFESQVSSISISSDGSTIAALDDKVFKVWSLATDRQLLSLAYDSDPGMVADGQIKLTADGKTVALSQKNFVRVWSVTTGQELTTLVGGPANLQIGAIPKGLIKFIQGLSFSPDGRIIATGNFGNGAICDCTLKLWDSVTGKELKTLEHLPNIPSSIVFSPDGKMVAWSDDSPTIKLWDYGSSNSLKDVIGHSDAVQSFAFLPDGRTLVSESGDGNIKFWDVTSAKEIKQDKTAHLKGRVLHNVISAANGRLIRADVEGNKIVLRNVANEDEIATLIAFDEGQYVVTTPEGRFDTSKSLDRIEGVHWAVNDEILKPLPLDVFMRQYYEPGLLQRVLSGEQFKQLPLIAEINRVQPRVIIKGIKSSPNLSSVDVTVEVENVTEDVSLRATGTTKKMRLASGAFDLRLFRDGQLVGFSTPQDKIAAFIDNAPRLITETKASGKLIDTPEDRAWRDANDLSNLKSENIKVISPERLQYTFSNIKLPRDGRKDVEFTAYAFNSDKVKSTTTDPYKFAIPAAIANWPKRGRAFLISIGVNASENPAYNLRYAVNDARKTQETVGTRLKADDKYSEVIQIPLISDHDSNLTRTENTAQKAIIKGVFSLLAGHEHEVPPEVLKRIPNRDKIKPVEPEDTLIITYAGHGYADQHGIFYLLPYDIGASTTKLTPQTLRKMISSDELSLWMLDITAAEMIMIIDACHSSAAVQGDGFRPAPMGSRGLGQLAYDKNMKILSATQADNAALELNSLEQGLLSYALIEDGIRNALADSDKNKQLSATEWLSFGEVRVPELYQEIRDGKRGVIIDGRRRDTLDSDFKLQGNLKLQSPHLFDFRRNSSKTALFTLP